MHAQEPLSERELEVLTLVVAGLSNKEIANELAIAVKTVEQYMTSLMAKLGFQSRVQAAVFAVTVGFVDPPVYAGFSPMVLHSRTR